MSDNRYMITGLEMDGAILHINHPEYGTQQWVLCRMTWRHRDGQCAMCHCIVGKEAYRPMGNPMNRMMRICKNHQFHNKDKS